MGDAENLFMKSVVRNTSKTQKHWLSRLEIVHVCRKLKREKGTQSQKRMKKEKVMVPWL
jgi:hypothetical protein